MIASKQFVDLKFSGFYNVGPDDCDCITTGELVDMFCQSWGGGINWVNKSDGGPHEANFLKLDCSRIKKTFGWRPKWGVNEAIKKTVEWSKAYASGEDISGCMDRQIEEFLNRNE